MCKSLRMIYDRIIVEQNIAFDFKWSTDATSLSDL